MRNIIVDEYDEETKEKIRDICQELFHNSFITEYVFAPNDSLKKANASYSFIMQHYEAIEELLEHCGWRLRHDEQVRVLYLTSENARAKLVLNKIESYFLLALRLIYDDKKSRASATGEVFITARDIVEQLTTLGAVSSVLKQDREKALRTLAGKNLIARLTGKWGDMDARLAILPSIVCVVSSDKTKSVLEMLSESDISEEQEEGTEE